MFVLFICRDRFGVGNAGFDHLREGTVPHMKVVGKREKQPASSEHRILRLTRVRYFRLEALEHLNVLRVTIFT